MTSSGLNEWDTLGNLRKLLPCFATINTDPKHEANANNVALRSIVIAGPPIHWTTFNQYYLYRWCIFAIRLYQCWHFSLQVKCNFLATANVLLKVVLAFRFDGKVIMVEKKCSFSTEPTFSTMHWSASANIWPLSVSKNVCACAGVECESFALSIH